MFGILGVLGIGYLVAAIVLRMRDANFFVDAADFLFVALSGAAFPIVVLPDVVRWIAYLLPTTHALDLVRGSPRWEPARFSQPPWSGPCWR